MQRKLHNVDREVLSQPGIRDMLIRDFTEASNQGPQGMADDMAANHVGHWGFALNQLKTPVSFWYLEQDRSVPPAMDSPHKC